MKKLSSNEYAELNNESEPLMTNMHSTNTQRKKVITTQAQPTSEPKRSCIHSINSIQFHKNWLLQHHHITNKTIKEIDAILNEHNAQKTEANIQKSPRSPGLFV